MRTIILQRRFKFDVIRFTGYGVIVRSVGALLLPDVCVFIIYFA